MTSKIDLLTGRYPELFPALNGAPEHFYGFTVDDGWLPIIEKMLSELSALGQPMSIVQIKEKFGSLRVYFDRWPEVAGPIVQEAQDRCDETCEVCGQPGRITNVYGLVKAVCPGHHEELLIERSKYKNWKP